MTTRAPLDTGPVPVARESTLGVKLDAWRVGAALLVVLEHARVLFLKDYEQLPHHGVAQRALYFVSGLGHAAVIVFFVLSGFFVGGSVQRAFERDRWDWRTYLSARLSRLWIVLIPALVLGLAWDLAGLHLFPAAPVYAGGRDFSHLMPPNLATQLTPTVFLGNTAFLAEAVPVGLKTPPVPALGSNGPLWSLTYEFGYYLLFPFLMLAARRKWAFGLAAILVAAILGPSVVALFPIWLMGAWLARSEPPAWAGSLVARAGALVLLLAAVVLHRALYAWHTVLADLGLGVAFTLYLATLVRSASGRFPRRLGAPVTFLANMSYTMYLAHLPPMVLVAAARGAASRFAPGPAGLAVVLAAVLTAILYSVVVWNFTERRTDWLRGWMTRRLGVA